MGKALRVCRDKSLSTEAKVDELIEVIGKTFGYAQEGE
jgi:hypothetical protein